MPRRPLFDHAPSELSQDAFICWLAEGAIDDERADLRDLGRTFIAWLASKSPAQHRTVDAADVELVRVRRQVEHVDVLIEARIQGAATTIVVEDKTNTSHHDDQLRRYSAQHPDAVCVYLKTGYHFGEDVDARAHGYAVIDLPEWVEFLTRNRVASDIFEDYRKHVSRLLHEREASLRDFYGDGGHSKLGIDYVQYEFAKKLDADSVETIGGSAINRGTNLGGTSWTHWRFARFPKAYGDVGDEVLFHRIDARTDDARGVRAFCLTTRQYARVKGQPAAQKMKLERLRDHRAAFAEAVRQVTCPLVFGRPATDCRCPARSAVI